MARLGFVGLGVMGLPMAGHLLRAGNELHVWSRTPGKADGLASEGAKVAGSLAELGAACEAVMLCVTRTEDVIECLDDLTSQVGANSGKLFVDHSTILPKATVEIHRSMAEKGCRFVDAPITGGSMGAVKGQLTIFCGGDQQDVDEAKRHIAPYTKRAERVGGPGAGQLTKMANQIAVGGSLLALCESLAFAKKAGLDIAQTRELLAGGAAASWAFENYGPKILAEDWSPGFTVANQVKDFEYCLETASELGAALPATSIANELLEEMMEDGDAGLTTAALYRKLLELES